MLWYQPHVPYCKQVIRSLEKKSIRNRKKLMVHTFVSVPGGLLWLLPMEEVMERLKQQTLSPGEEGSGGIWSS